MSEYVVMPNGQVEYSSLWKTQFDFEKMISHLTDVQDRLDAIDGAIKIVDAIITDKERDYYGDMRSDLRRLKAETLVVKFVVDKYGKPPPQKPKAKRQKKDCEFKEVDLE